MLLGLLREAQSSTVDSWEGQEGHCGEACMSAGL